MLLGAVNTYADVSLDDFAISVLAQGRSVELHEFYNQAYPR